METLSDKIIDIDSKYDDWSEGKMIQKKEVKEFIRKVKNIVCIYDMATADKIDRIDKLAGDDLI